MPLVPSVSLLEKGDMTKRGYGTKVVSPVHLQDPASASGGSWPAWKPTAVLMVGGSGEAARHGTESADSVLTSVAVAIVEDNVDMRRAYAAYLRSRGFSSVHTFETGEEFTKAVREGRIEPAIALVDYRLPGKDGIETAKGVSKLHSGMKVIVTTADDSVKREARTHGFRFLQKPFSLAALLRVMKETQG